MPLPIIITSEKFTRDCYWYPGNRTYWYPGKRTVGAVKIGENWDRARARAAPVARYLSELATVRLLEH